MPVAFAGAAKSPEATASASVKKQLKKLKKRVAQLEGQQGPTSLPPNGPAGGDLTGNYPNPLIGPNAVGSTELEDNAVASAKIADAAVGTAKIADNAVTTPKVANDAVTTPKIANGAVTSAKFLQNFTLNFDTSSVAANTCVQAPFSRDGVAQTDEVIVTPPDTQPLGIVTQANTRADANEVRLVTCNVTVGAIDPPAGDYEFTVIR